MLRELMTNRYVWLSVLTVIIVAVVIWSFYFRVPTTEEMQYERTVQDPRLLLMYAPWCGHCKTLVPTWDKMTREYGERMHKVNGDESPELMQKYDVKGFPTIVILNDDKAVHYQGDRSEQSLRAVLDGSTSRVQLPAHLEKLARQYEEYEAMGMEPPMPIENKATPEEVLLLRQYWASK